MGYWVLNGEGNGTLTSLEPPGAHGYHDKVRTFLRLLVSLRTNQVPVKMTPTARISSTTYKHAERGLRDGIRSVEGTEVGANTSKGTGNIDYRLLSALLHKREENLGDGGGSSDVDREDLLQDFDVYAKRLVLLN